jgi:Domain of unknown function (DUF4145)
VTWREFIAAMTRALAWPIVLAIVVFAFRERISELLGERLKRLKAGPIEAEWDRELHHVQESLTTESERTFEDGGEVPMERSIADVNTIGEVHKPEDQPQTVPASRSGPPDGADDVPSGRSDHPRRMPVTSHGGGEPKVDGQTVTAPPASDFKSVLAEVRDMVPVDPGAAVIMGYDALELAVRQFSRNFPTSTSRSAGVANLDSLVERGIMSDYLGRAILSLRDLRNAVSHSAKKPKEVTREEARKYVRSLEVAVRLLTSPASLYEAQVAYVLGRHSFSVSRPPNADTSVDLLAVLPTGHGLGITVKYHVVDSERFEEILNDLPFSSIGTLVVTREAPILAEHRMRLETPHGPITVVVWKPPAPEEELIQAAYMAAR